METDELELLISAAHDQDMTGAEQDRLGDMARELWAERDAARAEVERLEAIQRDLKLYLEGAERERDAARAEVEGLRRYLERANCRTEKVAAQLAHREALLQEAATDLKDAGHPSPRCEYFSRCTCGLDDLLQRIEAALKG